jgi:hypothetical protein
MTAPLHQGDAAAGPVRLDKWYNDTLLPDGSVLLVYFGSITVGAICLSRVTADLFLPDGRRRSGGAKGRRPVVTETGSDFGAGGFAADRLWWRTAGLRGEVAFTPRRLGFELRCPLLKSGRRSLHWMVEVPDADVRGEVCWPGGSMPVEGRGYRDRVWCDIPLWKLPIREVRWGRAFAGDHASIWVQATGPAGEVAEAWEDGHPISGAFSPPVVEPGRVSLEGPVVDLEGLRLGPLRGPLGRLLRAPHQVKTASAASIGGVEGRAVHEVVTWPG